MVTFHYIDFSFPVNVLRESQSGQMPAEERIYLLYPEFRKTTSPTTSQPRARDSLMVLAARCMAARTLRTAAHIAWSARGGLIWQPHRDQTRFVSSARIPDGI